MIRTIKKPNDFPFQWESSFLSNRFVLSCCFLLLFLFWGNSSAWGIQLTGVHYSACEREVGVILNVDDQKIQLLNQNGEIKEIRRFDIIYMVYYPLGELNIKKVEENEEIQLVSIDTQYNGETVPLLTGWILDHSEEQISFLTIEGKETVIDREDIWDIQIEPQVETVEFEEVQKNPLHFFYPYAFQDCQANDPKGLGIIYPQHLMEDPLMIKKELDRIQEGTKKIIGYDSNKKFYPVPQLYPNITTLGLWASLGSRYGNSKFRNSSFIPSVRSQLSEGPFGFQRLLVTGAAPMPYSVHEEPQVQFYYRMKSDYVHFSVMYDLNRVLIGEEKYQWQEEDMRSQDDRWNERFHIGGGFDWGAYAIDISINDTQYAINYKDNFFEDKLLLSKVGFFYRDKSLAADLYYGVGGDQKEEVLFVYEGDSPEEKAYIDYLNQQEKDKPEFNGDFSMIRVNVHFLSLEEFLPFYSLIVKNLEFEKEANTSGEEGFVYKSQTFTNSVYASMNLDFNIKLNGYLSHEYMVNRAGENKASRKKESHFFKTGVSISLIF